VKPGARALGLAFSDAESTSTCAGAVVTAAGRLDGLALAACSVGGLDATDAVVRCWRRLGREDVRAVLLAGVAPAWFNLLDLDAVHDATGVPVLSVSFEDSPGLEAALADAFEGRPLRRRLDRYDALPPRRRVPVDAAGADLFVRSVGADADRAAEILRATVPDGGRRPEPLRVARLCARAGRAYDERESEAPNGVDGGDDGSAATGPD